MEDERVNTIQTIFPNEHIQNALIDIVVNKRPVGWGRKSNAPYYKESHALEMKSIADKMILTRQDFCFMYKDWCDCTGGISRKTLGMKVNQSIHYLLEKLDTKDHLYRTWQEATVVRNQQWVGLMIRWKEEFRSVDMKGIICERQLVAKPIPEYRRKLMVWINSNTDQPFIDESVTLTEEERLSLVKELKLNKQLAAHITHQSIKIIRMN